MTVKNEKTIKELFDKVYGISYYGEHFNDAKNSMGIPYEFESNEKISEINSEIYSLKCKIVEEHKGKKCDIDDYEDLCKLVSSYDDLIKEFCYKMFEYGFTLGSQNRVND